MSDLAIGGATPTRTERYPPWPNYDDSERSNLLVDALPVPVEAAITSRTRAVIAGTALAIPQTWIASPTSAATISC